MLGIYQVWEEVMSYIKRFAPDYWIGTLNINVTKLGDIQSRTRVYFFLLRRDVAKVTSHGRFQSLLNRTLQNIYAEYKGRTCSRKLVQHCLCVFFLLDLLIMLWDSWVYAYMHPRTGDPLHWNRAQDWYLVWGWPSVSSGRWDPEEQGKNWGVSRFEPIESCTQKTQVDWQEYANDEGLEGRVLIVCFSFLVASSVVLKLQILSWKKKVLLERHAGPW